MTPTAMEHPVGACGSTQGRVPIQIQTRAEFRVSWCQANNFPVKRFALKTKKLCLCDSKKHKHPSRKPDLIPPNGGTANRENTFPLNSKSFHLLWNQKTTLMNRSIFMPDRGSHNIYHFIVYMLANLRHLNFTPDVIYIDTKESSLKQNYITELLSAIYPHSSIVNSHECPEGCTSLKQSPGPLSKESGVSPEEYIFLRELFLPIIANYIPQKTYSDCIYISRSRDSTKRRIMNENDLFKGQSLSNFELLTLSDLPMLEQMHIFSKAKVIVSPHGAALTHSLFWKRDAIIIEIVSKKMASLQHFKHIADTVGLRHERYTKLIEMSPKKYDSDLIIEDISAFQKYIEFASPN